MIPEIDQAKDHHPWCNFFMRNREGCSMCEKLFASYPLDNVKTIAELMKKHFPDAVSVTSDDDGRVTPAPTDPTKLPATTCATGRDKHCYHRTNLFHHTRSTPNGYHDCMKCCWCGFKWCRSTTHAKAPEGHGPFIMDAHKG